MKSAVALDSATNAQRRLRGDAARERQVEGRTFRLVNDVWTDTRDAGTKREVTVKAFSRAYFDLLQQIPELAGIAAIGDQVTVVGRDVVISVRTAAGSDGLTAAELGRIANAW